MAKKNTIPLKFEALDKELQNLLYSRDNSKLISVLKEGKNPQHLEQLTQLDVKSCGRYMKMILSHLRRIF